MDGAERLLDGSGSGRPAATAEPLVPPGGAAPADDAGAAAPRAESPSDLASWVAAWYQTPIARVTVANRTILRVTGVDVDLGYDQQSAAATVTVSAPVLPTWLPGEAVTISLGFGGTGGAFQPVFAGEIEDLDLRYFPHAVSVRAAGYLRRLQLRYAEERAWSNMNDGELWKELMRLAGVPRYQQDRTGDGIFYGQRQPVRLAAGETPRDLVDRLDQSSPTGMRTYEVGGTVYRSPVLGIPSNYPTTHYAQGGPGAAPGPQELHLAEIARTDTIAEIANRVVVTGLPEGETNTVVADRRAESPYVPRDANGATRDVAFDFSSELLETRAQCDLVAQRYLIEHNRRKDLLALRAPLNPLIVPGRTVGVRAEKLGLATERAYFVEHVRHSWGADGAFTELALVGGAGETGYLVGLDPVAAFTVTASRETMLFRGITQGVVTAHFDGSSSFDPDGVIVQWEWSASTGQSGAGRDWTCAFTDLEWEAGIDVTLTVTDQDADPTGPHRNSTTESVNPEVVSLIIRTLYVAAGDRAEATPDGGETWTVWLPPPGVVVLSTPQLAPIDHSYFGCSDGALYYTGDGLLFPPTLVHTFPGKVHCIWVHEVDPNRVWVGLGDGAIWTTAEASLGPGADWIKRADFDDRVSWIVASYASDVEVRACVRNAEYISFDSFGTYGKITDFGGGGTEALCLSLSFFGNVVAGRGPDAPVVGEGATGPVLFPADLLPQPTDVRATAFADRDGLMALDELGRAFVRGEGETAFRQVGSTGNGACTSLVRDGEQPGVFYAAGPAGLIKSYDAGGSWVRLRAYAGGAAIPDGVQVGYGALPMASTPSEPISRVWRGTDPYPETIAGGEGPAQILDNGTILACTLVVEGGGGVPAIPPADWMMPDFDDSVPWGLRPYAWLPYKAALVGGAGMMVWAGWDAWNDDKLFDAEHDLAAVYRSDEQSLFRHTFTLPPATYRRAFIDTWNLINPDALSPNLGWRDAMELYVNGHAVGPGRARAWIEPGWLVADGVTTNVIAVRGKSHQSWVAGRRCGWKLTCSTDPDGLQLAHAPDGTLVWTVGDDGYVVNTPIAGGPPAGWGGPARPEEANGPAGSQRMTPGSVPSWTGGGNSVGVFNVDTIGFMDVAGIGTIPGANPALDGRSGNYAWHRYVCRLPADLVVRHARLTVRWRANVGTSGLVETEHLQLALNGAVLEGGVDGNYEDTAPDRVYTFARRYDPVDPALLHPGELNVLAVLLNQVGSGNPLGYVAFYLEMR